MTLILLFSYHFGDLRACIWVLSTRAQESETFLRADLERDQNFPHAYLPIQDFDLFLVTFGFGPALITDQQRTGNHYFHHEGERSAPDYEHD